MLSFSGYVNDVCFKTGLTSSVEYNYPNKTNYLTSSTCKGTQKIFPNLFVTSQCVANPAANNDDLYGSNFYKSGLVNGDWTNPPKFPDSAGSGTPMAMNSVSIAVITVLGIVILGLVGGIAALCMYRNKLLYRGLSGGFDMSDDNELNFMDIHIEQTLDNRNPAMEM